MWNVLWFLVVFGVLISNALEEFSCVSMNTCNCISSPPNFEFHCPSTTNFKANIKYKPNNTLKIFCRINTNFTFDGQFEFEDDTEPITDLNFLPKLNSEFIDDFDIDSCPLPEGSLKTTLDVLGVKTVKKLGLKFSPIDNYSLGVNYFNSIREHLEMITLHENELEEIDKDMFAGMDKLTSLEIQKNNLVIADEQFIHLKNLNDLGLPSNSINDLPRTAFKGLKKLKILHLWSNSLSKLDSNVFNDLVDLRSLELSRNTLENIPEDVFSKLENLYQINIGWNSLSEVPANLFRNNPKLKNIRMENNPDLTTLPNNLFYNNPTLKDLNIGFCSLRELPKDLFKNTSNLTKLNLEHNQITTLPPDIFANLKNLETLILTSNKLSQLPPNVFQNLQSLKELNLERNLLQHISENLLKSAKKLQTLRLERNQISKIDLKAFDEAQELEVINLSHNKITMDEFKNNDITPFNSCVNIITLDLSYNQISYFFEDFCRLFVHLKVLRLNNNNFTKIEYTSLSTISEQQEIHLENNSISEVDLSHAELLVRGFMDIDARSSNTGNRKVYLDNNPIICDCRSFDLLRYFNMTIDPRVRAHVEIIGNNLICAEPENFFGISVATVKPYMVTCNVQDCPSSCDCAQRPHDNSYIVDCSGRNLTKVPVIGTPRIYFKRTEVYLQNNLLTDGPSSGMGYSNVTILNLSNNAIRNIQWIPSNLKVLNMDNNNLTRLSNNILSQMNMSVTLHKNPWICDCNAVNFSHYVRDNIIPRKSEIRCNMKEKQVRLLTDNVLCETQEILIIIITVAIVLLITIPSVMAALYYKYTQEIKVWLFAHNMCLWWVTEEDLDKDKKYDAFISYSHVDENFVIEEIVTKLESGPNPYNLCIHTRNWIPGEFIATQAMDSVYNSRRTIVVLSPNFLESVWGKMEFRTAHTQAMTEGRTRVIVIIYGDIDLESNVDEELKAYLKTNTYIKWGDPWFWQKLKYALPHRQNPVSTRKFDNISLHIDKMDLINGNITANNSSTPPVDPLLFKLGPNFKSSDDIRVTPPAESGYESNRSDS